MLRAARLECRLDFQLDPHSEEMINDALPLLERVSGDRIRHELELIFLEDEPECAICRLEDLGVLEQIHPNLRCDEWLQTNYQALRQEMDPQTWNLKAEDLSFIHLAVLAYRLDEDDLEELSKRLKVKRDDEDDLLLMHNLQQASSQLVKEDRPSAICRLLEPYPARVLATTWLATDSKEVAEILLRYQTDWRLVEPIITGNDLKDMGLKPGPLFGRLLRALRDARLDGEVSSRKEEEAFLEHLLALEKERTSNVE
jgi:tRNA nucleotidyltransferase (CCA-adding enzyme)